MAQLADEREKMKPLKDIYTNKQVFKQLAKDVKRAYPKIKAEMFYDALIDNIDSLELKARIQRAADVCYDFFPKDYLQSLKILYRFVRGKKNNLIYLFLPDFIARYGQNYFSQSMKALSDFTEYSSSEEGVRTFLEQNHEQTLLIMLQWTQSKNTHIRRLASEGSRPRLPWAKKIPLLIEKPELTWNILDSLKNDKEQYVQKSVANHINDISKDHPAWVIKKIQGWDLTVPSTRWIVEHGMRSLIKQGDKGALKLFGNHHKPLVRLENAYWNKEISWGGILNFSTDIVSTGKKPQKLIIDYKMHFLKKNGEQKPKVFKLKKYILHPQERLPIKVKYAFRNMTTRKHYPGVHFWQIVINGESMNLYPFEIKK